MTWLSPLLALPTRSGVVTPVVDDSHAIRAVLAEVAEGVVYEEKAAA